MTTFILIPQKKNIYEAEQPKVYGKNVSNSINKDKTLINKNEIFECWKNQSYFMS